jgi:predicted nucleic acid-binding protein
VTALLDTDVLVDCLRGTSSSAKWLESLAGDSFQVPGIVAMELAAGSRSKGDLKVVRRFLDQFDIVWPEAGEFARAFDLLVSHRLDSGLGIPDCLIASMALARSATIYTFNARHYRVVPGLDVREPYPR